jgi:hypothetical protein
MKNTKCNILKALGALMLIGFIPSSFAGKGAEVTSGDFQTFATGIERSYNISGHASMVRIPSGKTIVSVHVKGLFPDATYPVHVHNQPCDVNNGGGHYQNEVDGVVDNVNEIWPGFTTNASGIGNGDAKNDFIARPEAQSVVVHDTDAARIACADLN